jgi:hypothetical protein
MLAFQVETPELNFDDIYIEVLHEVAKNTIKEIKRLIKNGKNIHNEDLIHKSNKQVPDFDETGLLLSSLDYEIKDNKIIFYINNTNRNQVLYDLQHRKNKNWKILDSSVYIQNYIANQIDKLLEEKLNSI